LLIAFSKATASFTTEAVVTASTIIKSCVPVTELASVNLNVSLAP
jgi:hypothetical protein